MWINVLFLYSSDANSEITTRDFKDEIETLEKDKKFNATLGMIDFISSSQQKVCLVVIDYAGLSTGPVNIQQFIKYFFCLKIKALLNANYACFHSDNDTIEKRVIDCFPYICDATLSPFNSRETPRQRSKISHLIHSLLLQIRPEEQMKMDHRF
ncbi:hypothetical protein BD408DRAFT_348363 [Parasitella parasitica]|nr:hypothetical protein BD408DRAFT_348363 [Parasitella parasitica]